MNKSIVLKPSQYNVYQSDVEEKRLLVFNTLSRKEACINGISTENQFLHWLTEQDESRKKQLEKLGLVTPDLEEERICAIGKISDRELQESVLYLTILPTLGCNFRCVYCAQTGKGETLSSEDYSVIYSYIEKNIEKRRVVRVGWFGGEPLLCKADIIDFSRKVKELCRSKGLLYVSEMTTNGYELDYDTFANLFKAGVRYYQITLDGDREIHNYQRPHYRNSDSFERILGNLIEIKNREKSKLFEIGIRINVSKKSYPSLEKFIDLLYQYFENDIRFKVLWQWVRDWGGSRIEKEKEEKLGNDVLSKELYEKSMKHGLQCKELLSEDYIGEACEAKYKDAVVIGPQRKLYKCSMHLDDSYSFFGVLNQEGVIELKNDNLNIWNAQIEDDEKCKHCVYYPLCRLQSCPYIEKMEHSNKCMEFKNLIKVQMKMIYKNNKAIVF